MQYSCLKYEPAHLIVCFYYSFSKWTCCYFFYCQNLSADLRHGTEYTVLGTWQFLFAGDPVHVSVLQAAALHVSLNLLLSAEVRQSVMSLAVPSWISWTKLFRSLVSCIRIQCSTCRWGFGWTWQLAGTSLGRVKITAVFLWVGTNVQEFRRWEDLIVCIKIDLIYICGGRHHKIFRGRMFCSQLGSWVYFFNLIQFNSILFI